jgi:hypothetical protein
MINKIHGKSLIIHNDKCFPNVFLYITAIAIKIIVRIFSNLYELKMTVGSEFYHFSKVQIIISGIYEIQIFFRHFRNSSVK